MKIFDATLFSSKPLLPANFTPIAHINENFFCDVNGPNAEKLRQYMQGRSLVFLDIESQLNDTPQMYMQIAKLADQVGDAPFGFFVDQSQLTDSYAPVLSNTNAIFPCAYVMDTNIDIWEASLLSMMNNARKVAPNVPVYPFLWFNYADWLPIQQGYIGNDNWRRILKVTERHADGAVIWGGAWPMPQWDDNAAWWSIVRNYL